MSSLLVAQLLALSITIVSPCARTVPGETTPACRTCNPATGPPIGTDPPVAGAVAFNPAAPVAGVNAAGCATLTYTCVGDRANIDLNDGDITIDDVAGAGAEMIMLTCNGNNQWQFQRGNGPVVNVDLISCLVP